MANAAFKLFKYIQNPFRTVPPVTDLRWAVNENRRKVLVGEVPTERRARAESSTALQQLSTSCAELFTRWTQDESYEEVERVAQVRCAARLPKAVAACAAEDRIGRWTHEPLYQRGSASNAERIKQFQRRQRMTSQGLRKARAACADLETCQTRENLQYRSELPRRRAAESPDCAVLYRAQSPALQAVNVPGTWVHGTSLRSKKEFQKWRCSQGEVCVSSAEHAQTFFGQGVDHLGLVLRGVASALFSSDVGSHYEGPGGPRRINSTSTTGFFTEDDARRYMYDEAWLRPDKSEVIAIVADNTQAANRALNWGVPVVKPTGEPWTRQEVCNVARYKGKIRRLRGTFGRLGRDKPEADVNSPDNLDCD